MIHSVNNNYYSDILYRRPQEDGTVLIDTQFPSDVQIGVRDKIYHPGYSFYTNCYFLFEVLEIIEERPCRGNWTKAPPPNLEADIIQKGQGLCG